MKKTYIFALGLNILAYLPAVATMINIPDDYPTIQQGIDASVNGDTVLVADGTYAGAGNRDMDFAGKRILLKSQHGSDSTIINCEGNPAIHRGFNFHNAEDSLSVIDGFTIKHGYTMEYGAGINCNGASPKIINCALIRNDAKYGGGISCRENSDARIMNCTFEQNFAISSNWPADGGGIYCESSAVVISGCDFIRNTTFLRGWQGPADGAGIYCVGSPSPIISLCTFNLNNAWTYGGGIFSLFSSPTIEDCVFDTNYADSHGGAICCESSAPTISRCTFSRGYGRSDAGAIYCNNSSPIVTNCLFDNNYSHGSGCAISCYAGSYLTLIDCNIRSHTWVAFYGGAIYCEASAIDFNNCNLTGNIAQDRGGAIYLTNTEGVLRGCQFDSNAAVQGGAICFINSDSVTLMDCGFFHDTTDSDAGAIYCQYSSPTFRRCSFEDNVGGFGASVSAEFASTPVFENCLFLRNTGYSCAGIGLYSNCSTKITNCAFYGNSGSGGSAVAIGSECDVILENTIIASGLGGAGISCADATANAILSCCDIFGNAGGDWVGCIADQLGIRGNISVNPNFRNITQGDLRLKSTACGDSFDSPCIDTGSPAIVDSLLDCAWGLGIILSDMGAYGGGDSAAVAIDDLIERLPARFALLQNFPNPFNSQTAISFVLPETSKVKIQIYDIMGRQIETCLNEYRESGTHEIIWDAGDLSTGIYFYTIQTDNYVRTNKMILLR